MHDFKMLGLDLPYGDKKVIFNVEEKVKTSN